MNGWLLTLGCTLLAASVCGAQTAQGVARGWELYRLGEFQAAEREFARATVTEIEAVYGLAVTWDWRRPGENRERARQLYEEVIARAPASEWAAWSALALARQAATQPPGQERPVSELLAAYHRVWDRYPDHPAGQEAFLFLQATRLAQREPDAAAARAELEQFIASRPSGPYVAVAWGLVAYACEALGDGAGRLAALLKQRQTTETDPLSPIRDLAAMDWQIATVAAFEAGDFAVAREYFERFIALYPTDQKVFLAKQQLRRMDELERQLREERR